MSARLDVRVLGRFEATVDGRRLDRAAWQRLSAERLVKLLLVTPGHRLPREIAAEKLWPDGEPDASRANLRKALHFASQALGGSGLLTTHEGTIALDVECLDVDLDRLQSAIDRLMLAERRFPVADERADDLRDAIDTILELGAQELLPDDAYEDWLVAPRERLRGLWQRTALRAARRAQAAGRTSEAHELVGELLGRDPTDEAAHRLAIELYAAEGRHHAARRQFEQCRDALRESLDVEPSAETMAVYQALNTAGDSPGRPAPRLIARRAEIERIEPVFDRVAGGRPGLVVMRGAAGIGKSRLLDEVLAYARAGGWRVASWQAVPSGEGIDFAPLRIAVARLLQSDEVAAWDEPARSGLATLVPGLAVTPALRFEERPALLAALVAALAATARRSPLVIAIDDLAWLDASSIALLGATVSGLTTSPILIALTYRDDEPVPPHVSGLLDQIRRAGAVEVALGPLTQRDLEQLVVSHLGGSTMDPDLARLLYDQSLGNPLFCLALVAAARERSAVTLVDGRWTLATAKRLRVLPDSVRQLVARRSETLPAHVRELLAVAAELGPEIGYETLDSVLPDLEGGVLPALDMALDAGLLVERGIGYAFAHPLYRLAVQGSLGARRRGDTQLAIARTLAGAAAAGPPPARSRVAGTSVAGTPAAGTPAADPSVEDLERAAAAAREPAIVAEHAFAAAELGVTAALPLAVAYGFAAGHRALSLFNRDVAREYFERALAAHARLPAAVSRRFAASDALARLAGLHMAAGDDTAAAASFRAALRAARTPGELASVYTAFYWLPYRHGDFAGAIDLLDEGLACLPVDEVLPRAQLERDKAWCLVRSGHPTEALPILEAATPVLDRSPERREAMKAFDLLGDLLGLLGRSDEAIERLERSLAIALETHDSGGEILARIHLVATLVEARRARSARPHAERSLELARLVGDRYVESVAAWMAASMEDALGNPDRAGELRLRELDLLESIGGNSRNESLAHAHLSNLARRRSDVATAAREAALARSFAALCADPDYAARIERSLTAGTWAVRPA